MFLKLQTLLSKGRYVEDCAGVVLANDGVDTFELVRNTF
jgi:hypothetical protein